MKKEYVAIALLIISILGNAQDPKRFQSRINELTTDSALATNKNCDYLFVGSSSIVMWKNVQDYFPDKKVVNHGFGGSEMSDLLFYLHDIVIPFNPKVIFIYEGDNDLGNNESIDNIYKEMNEVISIIKKELPGIEIFIISPKPSIARWDKHENYEKLNAIFKEFCSKTEDVYFIDVWNPVIQNDGQLRKDIFIEDGLHLNETGYQIWYEIIQNSINENL